MLKNTNKGNNIKKDSNISKLHNINLKKKIVNTVSIETSKVTAKRSSINMFKRFKTIENVKLSKKQKIKRYRKIKKRITK